MFSRFRNNVAQGTKPVSGRQATGEMRSAYAPFKINHRPDQTAGLWTFWDPYDRPKAQKYIRGWSPSTQMYWYCH